MWSGKELLIYESFEYEGYSSSAFQMAFQNQATRFSECGQSIVERLFLQNEGKARDNINNTFIYQMRGRITFQNQATVTRFNESGQRK